MAVEPLDLPQNDNGTKTPTRKRIVLSLVVIAIFILLTLAFWYWWPDVKELITFISDQDAFGDYLRSFGVLAPLVLFAAQMIQVFIAFIPGHVVSISGGYVFLEKENGKTIKVALMFLCKADRHLINRVKLENNRAY